MAAWSPEILAVATAGLLIFAALVDIATRTIPDGVVIAVAVLGICARLLSGLPGLMGSLLAALILFASLVFLNARGMMGGGDVKLAHYRHGDGWRNRGARASFPASDDSRTSPTTASRRLADLARARG
jgi:hypothetical protein